MKVMIAFLGKKKNKRNEYLEQIKNIHKNKWHNYQERKKEKSKNEFFSAKREDRLDFDRNYDKNNIESLLTNSHFSMQITISMLVCVIFTLVLFKIPHLKVWLTTYSNNFRQASDIKIDVADMISTVSLFQKKNYMMQKEQREEENGEEKKEADSEEKDEYQILDEEAEKYDLTEVMAKNQTNVNILSENATVQKVSVDNSWILNYSSNRNIDFASILSKDVILTKKSDKILLYNTHTSESYTNSDAYQFEYSSVMRSLDARFNMIAIAKELNENLLKKGFLSNQDTTPHDYGAYTGAYGKSRQTVTNALTNIGGAGIIMDVHRDAMEDLTFRPVVNIKGIQVSQLMFVVGIGDNPYWEDNLRLALKLQKIANKVYPGLFRQMIIRDSTYNQDLNRYSMLVEFGATGNTIDEVKLSTRCLANLLNILYKD